jgi:hypothetical protein
LSISTENRARSNWHARVFRNALQRASEISDAILRALSLMSKASDGPDVDFDTSVELLASHVPDTLVWNGLNCF